MASLRDARQAHIRSMGLPPTWPHMGGAAPTPPAPSPMDAWMREQEEQRIARARRAELDRQERLAEEQAHTEEARTQSQRLAADLERQRLLQALAPTGSGNDEVIRLLTQQMTAMQAQLVAAQQESSRAAAAALQQNIEALKGEIAQLRQAPAPKTLADEMREITEVKKHFDALMPPPAPLPSGLSSVDGLIAYTRAQAEIQQQQHQAQLATRRAASEEATAEAMVEAASRRTEVLQGIVAQAMQVIGPGLAALLAERFGGGGGEGAPPGGGPSPGPSTTVDAEAREVPQPYRPAPAPDRLIACPHCGYQAVAPPDEALTQGLLTECPRCHGRFYIGPDGGVRLDVPGAQPPAAPNGANGAEAPNGHVHTEPSQGRDRPVRF